MRASFRIAVEENEAEEHWTSTGINQVTYRIATNAGETMRPLEQIASGGELSRVMLALKASVEAGANPAGKKKSAAAQLPDRKAREFGSGQDYGAVDHGRRAYRRSGADALRGQADGDFAEACGADD